MTKLLIVYAPHFVAGLVAVNDKVVKAAPIIKYLKNKNIDQAKATCERRGWPWIEILQ